MRARLRDLVFAAVLAATSSPALAQDIGLRGALDGDNVVSATESPATGEVAAVLGEDGSLRLDMVFAGLQVGATGAALHTGRINENGPLVARLDIAAGATAGRLDGAEIRLTPLDAAAVRAGNSYVVVSTLENPDGAIRAQLLPQPVRLDAPVDDTLAPPPVAPPPIEPTPIEESEEEPEEDDYRLGSMAPQAAYLPVSHAAAKASRR